MNRDSILKKLRDIAENLIKLKNKYLEEKNLPIDYLTIFTHSGSEFKNLKKAASKLGKVVAENNGPAYLLNKPITIPTGQLKIFRIRKPDPERPQVGCGDFEVKNFEEFKNKYCGVLFSPRDE